MPVPIIPVSLSAAAQKMPKSTLKTGRNTRKNPLLLNNRALVDGILGRQEERENLSDEQLQDQTAEIKPCSMTCMQQISPTYWKHYPTTNVWHSGGWLK